MSTTSLSVSFTIFERIQHLYPVLLQFPDSAVREELVQIHALVGAKRGFSVSFK